MALAVKVYSEQAEDADRGTHMSRQRVFVDYGLAGLSIGLPWTPSDLLVGMSFESSRPDLYYSLLETTFVMSEPNSAALAEPISVFFSEVPSGEGSFSVSPMRDDNFILYTEPRESSTWYGTKEEADFIGSFRSIVGDLGHLPIEIEQRLRELAILKPNWDSYGALPVNRVALEKTRLLLTQLYSLDFPGLPSPFIAPDPEGGLGLEWDFGAHGELYLEVSSKGQITYVLTMGGVSDEQQHTSTDDLRGIEQIFKIMQP